MIPSIEVSEQSIPPNTTVQEDLTTAGQRRINIIWEVTQSVIACSVVLSCMIVGVYQALHNEGIFPATLSNAFFLIVGFYFSRTNHAAIGGVGIKPNSPYLGR